MEEVKASELGEINLAPETEAEDIKQCVAMICNTTRGTVPYMRGFGLSGEFLHGLSVWSKNDIAEDVANQIEEYEERVEAEDLVFGSEDENGNLEYSIPYSIISEEEEDDDE